LNGYTILIRYCDIDNIYVAKVPDLEGCQAHGDTPEEAAKEIQTAIKLWLQVAQDVGKEIPKPMVYAI